MLQIIQSLSDGQTGLVDVPAPQASSGHLQISTRASVVSAGTERMLLEFGRKNLLQKAMSQPQRVKQVIDKARTDGVMETLTAVRAKLDQPIQLGYCNAGVVTQVGRGVEEFAIGDRVVSNGPHAQTVVAPWTLCARVPDDVSDETAAFTPVAAIGLQGVRLAAPTIGERIVVMGLGLIGLLTVQILRANGCQVLGADFDAQRLALARKMGARVVDLSAGQDVVAEAMSFSGGLGVDAVLITASTDSNAPVEQAARMSRKRGRIVLVGVSGLTLDRDEFFRKELTFQVSCSYGPGRYDPQYEDAARDYPFGYVRWTEKRNFEAVLDLMSRGAIDVTDIVTHRFEIADAIAGYGALSDSASIGIVLSYPASDAHTQNIVSLRPASPSGAVRSSARVSVIGAGNFASRVLIPALKAGGADLRTLVSRTGLSARLEGQKAGFANVASELEPVFADPDTDAIVIATRHDTHADLVVRALNAGKSVFVEKPLALNEEDIDRIVEARDEAIAKGAAPVVMVGFNRRFAPLAERMRSMLSQVSEPKTFIALMNAGAIPADHWTQDSEIGGGRIVGEACHYIDFIRYLTGAPIVDVKSTRVDTQPADGVRDDKASLTIRFADGSHGTVHYFANGSKAFPKERVEAFCAGRIMQLDNFRELKTWGWPGAKGGKGKMDKGHSAGMAAFLKAVRGEAPPPIPFEQIVEVARWSVRAARFED